MGCPLVQGYYLARPMSAEALAGLLRQQCHPEPAEIRLLDRQPALARPLVADGEAAEEPTYAGSVPLRLAQ
jgi:predicted signal transduction protein with EAL and GGDEF domain